jgi:hypothetical protein
VYAYSTIGEELGVNPDDAHRMNICKKAAGLMVEQLTGNEHPAQVDIRGGWSVDEHAYVDLLDGRIADGTWQQFLGKLPHHPTLPKCSLVLETR